jgi:hypothetical protein
VGTNGIPRATYSGTRTDFAPRIGIAWRPLKSERWVVRSAYGIFYDVPIANINIFPRINPPFYDLAAYFQDPTSCPGGLCTVQDLLSLTGQQAGVVQGNMISPKFRDGYMQQWNADLQYEVLPNWMVDAAYVGSKGTHLSDVLDRNQVDPLTGFPPYPQFSSILFVESNANSAYNSLQLRSEKRMSHGLALLLSYTYSKSTDDISSVFGGSVGSGLPQNSRDLAADRGPSDFSALHRFSGSFIYDLPLTRLLHGSGWGKKLLDNWQAGGIITAQSGSPFTVVLAGAPAASAAAFGNPARPDLVGDPNKAGTVAANSSCNAPAQVRTPQSWFNVCAFAIPAGPYGTEGRNSLTGPGYTNIDFSLAKSIAFREGHRLQLRGEFFNLLNHPNFDIPSHVFGVPNFGVVLSANSYGNKPPRQIQLSVKYIF